VWSRNRSASTAASARVHGFDAIEVADCRVVLFLAGAVRQHEQDDREPQHERADDRLDASADRP
jgi:hypothetical protein